jgi:hypothetical protein
MTSTVITTRVIDTATWANDLWRQMLEHQTAALRYEIAKAVAHPIYPAKCISCGSTEWRAHGGKSICSYCRNSRTR